MESDRLAALFHQWVDRRETMHASRRPSPATVIALFALFFALGGTAIAAHHYLITNTSQIKPSVLRSLHGNAGRPGPAGAAGPAGLQGPAGPSNLSGLTAVEAETSVAANEVEGIAATCPAGQHAVSGGGAALVGAGGLNVTKMSTDHQSWFAITNNEAIIPGTIRAYAYCAGAGQAVAARSNAPAHERAVREVRRIIAQLTTSKD